MSMKRNETSAVNFVLIIKKKERKKERKRVREREIWRFVAFLTDKVICIVDYFRSIALMVK